MDEREKLYELCCQELGLDATGGAEKITAKLISRKYKKLCLTAHPDKGSHMNSSRTNSTCGDSSCDDNSYVDSSYTNNSY